MSYLRERSLADRWAKNGVSYGSSASPSSAGTKTLKMVNVDRSGPATRGLLERLGFLAYTPQYEMELSL